MNDLIKLLRGCAVCGYNKHPDALEWDHISGGGGHAHHTRNRRNTFLSVWDQLRNPNLQVLCANHHNIKSRVEQRNDGLRELPRG